MLPRDWSLKRTAWLSWATGTIPSGHHRSYSWRSGSAKGTWRAQRSVKPPRSNAILTGKPVEIGGFRWTVPVS